MKEIKICPCGSGNQYLVCCAMYLTGQREATTAERLMRARYTAYAVAFEPYLLRTWHTSTRPPMVRLDGAEQIKWLGLRIIRTEAGGEDDINGLVEFAARYKIAGKAERLHEVSQFVKENALWFYLSGDTSQRRLR